MSGIDYFISYFHFDGVRLDAISNVIYWHGDCSRGENTGAIEFIKRLTGKIHIKHPDVMLIAEDSSAYQGVTKPLEYGGLGFDYKWDLGWMNDTLKYFQEEAFEYHIVVAGSLLGITLHQSTGFPVGKVDQLTLYPMSFKEFLLALNEDILVEQMEHHNWKEMDVFHEKLKNYLRQYYYVGGMPEVVKYYAQTKEIFHVREIQNRILLNYRQDFSKHIPGSLLTKVNLVWDSVPAQLAKENKKFIYGMLKKGGRAKEFEDAIQWLVDAGLVFRVNRINKVCMPLKFYEEFNAFKLYLLDLGLLGAMVDAPAKNILIGDNVFKEYKGAFTEQYVAQQIVACNVTPKYYNNENSTNEIDFVVQLGNVYPIEVKAEENLKSKSMNTLLNENEDMEGWKFSMSTYRTFKQVVNIPLYDVDEWILMYKEKMLDI